MPSPAAYQGMDDPLASGVEEGVSSETDAVSGTAVWLTRWRRGAAAALVLCAAAGLLAVAAWPRPDGRGPAAVLAPEGAVVLKHHKKKHKDGTEVSDTTANVPEYVSNSSCGADCACPSFEEVLATQKAWGDALVKISTTYEKSGWAAAKAVAEEVIDGAYGYNMGPVLFNPTLTCGSPSEVFRVTREGALAYFVGNDPNFPADEGFALKDWRKVEFDNKAWFLDCDVAMTMGNVHITNKTGQVTTVDKTFGYARDKDGALRIVMHHSGVPNNVRFAEPRRMEADSSGKAANVPRRERSHIPVSDTTANVPVFVSNSSCSAECACPSFEEVLATQKAWGDALVKISRTYETQGWAAANAVAQDVIDGAYGYNMGPVLFNPTLTSGSPSEVFRVTREGALAYFVGNDPNFPNDDGFALKNWRIVEFDNKAWFLDCNVVMTMGNVHITNSTGQVTTVDKTFGYAKDKGGALRIVLHHSALPNDCPV